MDRAAKVADRRMPAGGAATFGPMGIRAADNRVASVLAAYREQLAGRYDEGEVRAIARAVFMHRLGWDAAQIELRRADALHESDLLKVYLPLKRLRAGEPLQHVLGRVRFFGLDLAVTPAVLIPRPETEELVERIRGSGMSPRTIIDVGTGSGCIALALKRCFPQATVTGLDVSEDALAVARANARSTGLEVAFHAADALDAAFTLPHGLDLVVSNPPYIPVEESASLDEVVRGHEPHLALFAPPGDTLAFYRAIGTAAITSLAPDGRLWFEAHHRLAGDAADALRTVGFRQVEVLRDLSGHDRFITCAC